MIIIIQLIMVEAGKHTPRDFFLCSLARAMRRSWKFSFVANLCFWRNAGYAQEAHNSQSCPPSHSSLGKLIVHVVDEAASDDMCTHIRDDDVRVLFASKHPCVSVSLWYNTDPTATMYANLMNKHARCSCNVDGIGWLHDGISARQIISH